MKSRDVLVRGGTLVEGGDDVVLGFLDGAFLYGEGCFETLRTYDGRAFAVAEHHARLADAARAFDLPRGLVVPDLVDVQSAIDSALDARAALGASESLVRLALVSTDTRRPTDRAEGSVLFCHATDLPPEPVELRARGARLVSRGALLGPGAEGLGVSPKCMSYALRRAALRWAMRTGADEVALFSDDGYLQSGATCNLALLFDRRLVTPPADGVHVRAGVTVARLFRVAERLGFTTERRAVAREEWASASGAMLTSSLREVVPVASLDGVPIGGDAASGGVGWDVQPWVRALRETAALDEGGR